MSDPELDSSKPANAGFRLFAAAICFCAFVPLIWSLLHWLVSFFVPAERAAAVRDNIDLVGAMVIAVVLGVGFNYVVWKYVEDRWLRWVVFGIEGIVGAFLIYVLLIDRQPTPR